MRNSYRTENGGKLSVLYLSSDSLAAERQRAIAYPSWDLTERQVCVSSC